jgi:hypothetical protein
MTGGEQLEDVDAALAEAFGTAPETIEMVTPKARRAREKQMRLSPTDGRRKRRTGRTVQLNTKMRADLKARVVQASRDQRMPIAELIEAALIAHLATLEKRHG